MPRAPCPYCRSKKRIVTSSHNKCKRLNGSIPLLQTSTQLQHSQINTSGKGHVCPFFLISGKKIMQDYLLVRVETVTGKLQCACCVCVRTQQTCSNALVVVLSPKGSPTAHHPSGPGQPNAGAGRRVTAEVPGIRRARAHCHLEKKRTQPGWERPPLLPAGARQPSDPKHQGSWFHCSDRGGDSSLGECEDCFHGDTPLPFFIIIIIIIVYSSLHWLSSGGCTVS